MPFCLLVRDCQTLPQNELDRHKIEWMESLRQTDRMAYRQIEPNASLYTIRDHNMISCIFIFFVGILSDLKMIRASHGNKFFQMFTNFLGNLCNAYKHYLP